MTLGIGWAWLASYLVGSFPTGYLLVKWLRQVDVREIGSGNIGATNVARTAGKGVGILVLAIDLLKGLIAVRLIALLTTHPVTPTAQFACGVAAVLGHNFPVTLGFRGGKGVATTVGVIVGVIPLTGVLCLAVWLACFLRWRYVSVASLAAAVALPVTQAAMHRPMSETALGATLALLILIRHRANITRLLRGDEHRWKSKQHAG